MTTAWMHPLNRATRILTVRLLELEKQLPDDSKDREGWEDYVRTCDVLSRIIACTAASAPPIYKADLEAQFGTKLFEEAGKVETRTRRPAKAG